MTVPLHLLTVGEALAVLHVEDGLPLAEATRFRRTVAGAELNVAHGFVRLGHRAGLVTAVGRDALGDAVLDRLRSSEIASEVQRIEAPTGVLIRELGTAGPIGTVHLRAGSAGSQVSADMVAAAWDPSVNVVYVTGITMVLSKSARGAVTTLVSLAREHGATVVLDPNLRERVAPASRFAEVLAGLHGQVDVVVGDLPELALFAGTTPQDAVASCLDLGCRVVVTKRGADGAEATDGHTTVSRSAIPIPLVVDTIGAGDAFTAGFLAGHLESGDLARGLDLGVRVAAKVVATAGDLEGFPRRRPSASEGENR